jgi:hypothetical protein
MDNVADVPNDAPKPMDEIALNAAIDDADNRSYGSNLSNLTAELSAERALNIDLYLGKNIDPAPDGQSNVIDRTVFEVVQWVLPALCRIFANGDDVVTLVPLNEADVEQAKQESAYLNWFVTTKLPWFDLFLEWCTDALLTKNAYFLAYRDNKRSVDIEKYEDQTKNGIALLLQDTNVQLIDIQQKPDPSSPPDPVLGPQGEPIVDANGQPMTTPAMLYDCTIRRNGDQKNLIVRVLPPERTKVDQKAYSWRIDDRCNYFEYWEETTLSELREQGFDIPADIADDPELYTQEDMARDEYGERRLERYKPTDPSMRRVKARMIWIRVDYDGDGTAELLQVLRVGRRILSMEEVSRIPVASGVACPLPHRHIGIALGDMVNDIQKIKTSIWRQALNNLYLSNDPQKIVNEQAVNLEDLLISRPGGIVRATDVAQIQYIEHPFVFPQAVEGLRYMDEVRQNRSGVNYALPGIDTKDLNNVQPGTVSQVSSIGAERIVQMARVLAFAIEDLFSILHELISKMGHKKETLQISGKWVEVDPGSWQRRTDFKIAVAFAAGNKDAQIAHLGSLLSQQLQAVELKLPIATPENLYNTAFEFTKALGLSAPERFWTDPKTLPPQPPPAPPPEIIKAGMEIKSREQIKAAELVQAEVESERTNATELYRIHAQTGAEIIQAEVDHRHQAAIEGLKATHTAINEALSARLAPAKVTGTGETQDKIGAQTLTAEHVNTALGGVMNDMKKAHALATGKRVVRHNDKGEIQGVDVHHRETGEKLASYKATKDASGRVTGLV